MKIDECSDEIIQSIESTQLECKKLSKEVTHLATEIKQSMKELDELISRFDTLEINYEKFGNIKLLKHL